MELTLEIDLKEEKKSAALAKALAGGKPKRSKVTITPKGTKLSIHIQAEDAVAMRSAVNSYLRLTDACLKITEG